MKKNAMLKIAAILMVAVLLTTCAISSTFAKYVTTVEKDSSGEAVVANWNLKIINDASAELFKPTFTDDTDDIVAKIDGTKHVLAPGTKNDSGAFAVSLEGKPEVAFAIYAYVNVELANWTAGSSDYCPVVFTVNGTAMTDKAVTGTDAVEAYETKIEEAIAAGILGVDLTKTTLKTVSKDIDGDDVAEQVYYVEYPALTDVETELDCGADVKWEWKFEGLSGQTDALDTELGNAATKATIEIDYAVAAEQIAVISNS